MDLYLQQQQQHGEQYYGWPGVYQSAHHASTQPLPLKYEPKSPQHTPTPTANGHHHLRPLPLRLSGVNKVQSEHQQLLFSRPESLVDLSKLKVASLRRYVKYFDLDGVASNTPKNKLVKIVTEHWKKLKFDESLEKQTILDFTRKYKQEKIQAKGSRRLRQQSVRREYADDEDYEI
eukprot:TRINITY_DN4402_c0_g2_i1.p1 TRINITY_DN4402_c0_g2~~TRINITY_DN4402_c0_g2_i1.p1  ORF type:complete len:176 (-),score=16.58 TRINITY_DN4402_c0_g2_i1:521-1048(-)